MSDFYDYNNEFEHDDFGLPLKTHQMPNGNGGGDKNHDKKRGGRRSAWAKKAGALALSGILFGAAAAGTFQAVNYVTGYSADSSASAGSEEKSSLLKATNISSNGSSETKGNLDVSDIAERVMPSIVSITNKSVQEVQDYFSSMFGYGAQPQMQETESRGSGIIIGKNDKELLIATNNHVVSNADTLTVGFIDNQACEAQVKGTDPENDLAVIAVSLESISADTMSKIAVAAVGDSEALKVGQQVVAIGNALGYGQSVTTGIVSATNRSITAQSQDGSSESSDTSTYIQTDAAINPGNSGGALLNMKGEVVGINSAKLSSTEIEGMGYAIPMARAYDIIENLMNETTRAKVSSENQGTLGITGLSVNSEIQDAYGIPTGVYVSEVAKGGAAENAGIEAKDVITKFDGKSISDVSELQSLLQYYSAGEKVEVTLQVPEGNGYTEKTITVTLDKPNNTEKASGPETTTDAIR